MHKGAIGRPRPVPSIEGTGDPKFRDQLLASGVTADGIDKLVFTKDHLFPTACRVGVAWRGRTANGWIEWEDTFGRAVDELNCKRVQTMDE